MERKEIIKVVILGIISLMLVTCYCKNEIKRGGIPECCVSCYIECRQMFGYINKICLRNCQRGCPMYCPPIHSNGMMVSLFHIYTYTCLNLHAHTSDV